MLTQALDTRKRYCIVSSDDVHFINQGCVLPQGIIGLMKPNGVCRFLYYMHKRYIRISRHSNKEIHIRSLVQARV